MVSREDTSHRILQSITISTYVTLTEMLLRTHDPDERPESGYTDFGVGWFSFVYEFI